MTKVSTSSLEKSGKLLDLPEDTEIDSPYGKHLSTVFVDVFDKGVYVSVACRNNSACLTKFIPYEEILKNVKKEESE